MPAMASRKACEQFELPFVLRYWKCLTTAGSIALAAWTRDMLSTLTPSMTKPITAATRPKIPDWRMNRTPCLWGRAGMLCIVNALIWSWCRRALIHERHQPGARHIPGPEIGDIETGGPDELVDPAIQVASSADMLPGGRQAVLP